jgi:prophage tail gpP-like protein
MSIEVRVNGKTYDLFKQVDISTSLDNFSNEARIITSEPVNDSSFITINDLIEIYLDGIQKITGYAEKITDGESNTTHDISYTVRDAVMDIIDSTVPDNVKSLKNVKTFKQLCELVVVGLGLKIKIVDDVGANLVGEIKAASVGQNANDFLQGYARSAQVFLNTDGAGNILIRRPSGTLQTILLAQVGGNNNNIIDSNINIDYSKRFNKYIVRSNPSVAASKKTDDLNQTGVAIDSIIRSTRRFEKIAETPMTAEQCKQAAAEMANTARLRSFNYTCKVVGYSANGELWEDGRFVKVQDDKKGMKGTFVIRSCSYSNSGAGEFTTLNLTYNDAYTNEPELTPVNERISKNASTYTIAGGDTLSGVAAQNNLTLQDLVAANPQIQNPDAIQEGQVINIPVTGGKT